MLTRKSGDSRVPTVAASRDLDCGLEFHEGLVEGFEGLHQVHGEPGGGAAVDHRWS